LREPLPIEYTGTKLDCGYRLDIVVENKIIIELKACDKIEPIRRAQVLTYLKLSGLNPGLLLNFNTPVMRDGIVRIVNKLKEEPPFWGGWSFCFPSTQRKAKE
jgi:GxxExxY protein